MQKQEQIKQYKPGQFVNIGGNLARVYSLNPPFNACECCKEVNGECPCDKAPIACECAAKLGLYYYPKLIKTMLKSGETVKILDKEYMVSPCVDAKYACRMCAEMNKHNGGIPCIQSGQYCITDWNQQECRKQLPANCYLKPKE